MLKCKACEAVLDDKNVVLSANGYDLVKCQNCGTWTASPFPTIDELTKFYQNYKPSGTYISKAAKKVARSAKRIKKLLAMTKGRNFLDVGCNHGYAVEAAANLGLDAYGIDVDVEAVNSCKARLGDGRFNAMQVEDYAASGAHSDIIYTSEVIEHVPSPENFVKALHKILNDDGILYLTTPDAGHFALKFMDLSKWDAVKPPEHIVYFTKKGIKTLLEKHGFEIVKFIFSLKPGIKLIARKK